MNFIKRYTLKKLDKMFIPKMWTFVDKIMFVSLTSSDL